VLLEEDLVNLTHPHAATPAIGVARIESGSVAWAGATGVPKVGDDRPVDTRTLFHACSMTKLVTAVCLLRLAQRGDLDLDADLEGLRLGWRLPVPEESYTRAVTLRDLLSHHSGIDDAAGSFEPLADGESLPAVADILRGTTGAHSGPVAAVRPPGVGFSYSDAGYAVVEHVVEVVTGSRFPEVVSDLVLAPLGLETAVLRSQDSTPASAATGHHASGEPLRGGWSRYPGLGGSGLWCTPTDFAVLLCDLLASWLPEGGNQPGILLSAPTAAEMLRPGSAEPAAGLGLFMPGGQELCVYTQGWGVGFQCAAEVHPRRGRGIVVMTNRDPGLPQHQSVVGHLLRLERERPERTVSGASNGP